MHAHTYLAIGPSPLFFILPFGQANPLGNYLFVTRGIKKHKINDTAAVPAGSSRHNPQGSITLITKVYPSHNEVQHEERSICVEPKYVCTFLKEVIHQHLLPLSQPHQKRPFLRNIMLSLYSHATKEVITPLQLLQSFT
ncbi:hypothetical protein AVEN_23316-1 [Araneus ventricosus]|uniref:Uncharacterized protein n=1 Tax=Araneus ventricosus TaxID=182803 RepID=A0A4Y2FUK8_ARAVE|nr:hypothetical protein AVEN_23316-1 [Araneus ventricosus]